jgi:cell division protein FtsW (lipid II flippase)
MSVAAPPRPEVEADLGTDRRTTELWLLVLGWAIGVFAFAQVLWATERPFTTTFWLFVVVSAGVGVALHLATKTWARHAEPLMLPTAYLLNLLGLAMIFRLDIAEANRAEANGSPIPTPVVISQLTWLVLGMVLLGGVLLLLKDHRILQRFTYISLLGAVVMLLLPLVPGLGTTINGATIWIRVGPFSFQPAEIGKILFAIFIAGFLVTSRDTLALVRRRWLGIAVPRGRDMGPLLIAWVIAMIVLVFERDFGTAIIFFGMFVITLYVATGRRSWLIIAFGLVTVGALFAYAFFDHVRIRFKIWLDPFAYANDEGFQIVQSLYGLANGGIFGTGLGQGYPQLVPFANSDFIISSFGEELGLTGLFAMLMMYAILVQRGLRTAMTCRDTFGRLLAVALSSVFALQVFVVVGGVTKLIPLTGLTTPFLSAGGSALVANWIMIGLLLRISDITRRPERIAPSGDTTGNEVVR